MFGGGVVVGVVGEGDGGGGWAFKASASTSKPAIKPVKAKRDFSLRGPTFRRGGREENASACFGRNDGLRSGLGQCASVRLPVIRGARRCRQRPCRRRCTW